jgi:hypothetical protein
MKSNRNFTNVLPLLVYALALLLFLLLPILALADGTGKIASVERLTPKELRSAETIVQHEWHGALLPFKTYQTDDSIARPKHWNGYGVDPSGVNYWTYWNEDTECLPGYLDVWEGTDHCKQEGEEENKQAAAVPEPSGMMLLGMLVCFVWLLIRRRA